MNMDQVEAALQQLADQNDGRLEPDSVVDAARNPMSPLHSHFTWDDSEAARKYRITQARQLIRSVTLVVTDRSVSFIVPKYLRDPEAPAKEQGYVAIAKLRGEDDLKREVCIREFNRAKEALSRAQGVAAYLGIEDQVLEGIAIIETLTRRAQEARSPGAA